MTDIREYLRHKPSFVDGAVVPIISGTGRGLRMANLTDPRA